MPCRNSVLIDSKEWENLLAQAKAQNFDSLTFLQAINESQDALNKAANLSLLADQLLYRLLGGKND